MVARDASLAREFWLDENQVQRRVENLTNYIQSLPTVNGSARTGEEPGNRRKAVLRECCDFFQRGSADDRDGGTLHLDQFLPFELRKRS